MSNYINTEELKEEIEKCHITSGVTNQGVWNECVDSILRTIDYIPPADVRENIHAEWERVSGGSLIDIYRCSKCKKEPDKQPMPDIKTWGWKFTDFCPNCGAEMRESKGEKIRCNTCKNNDDELSGECYECIKGIFDHYEPEER